MGAREDLDRLTDVADWTQGHNHQLVDFCDTICPRWATHAPWQCDPGGGCPKHHPGGNDEPEPADDDVVEALIIPKRPTAIQWSSPGAVWVVELIHDDDRPDSITLHQARPLRNEEIEAVNTAYESARWFRDHLAELHIG